MQATRTFWTVGMWAFRGAKSGKICQHGKSQLSLFIPSKRFNNFSHVQNVQFELGKSFMLNIYLLAVRTSTNLQSLLYPKK